MSNGEYFPESYVHRDSWHSGRCRFRLVLRCEIGVVAGHAVFVRAAVNPRGLGEITVWRRRGCLPFERGRVPWIVTDLFTVIDAPEQVDDERYLCQAQRDRR